MKKEKPKELTLDEMLKLAERVRNWDTTSYWWDRGYTLFRHAKISCRVKGMQKPVYLGVLQDDSAKDITFEVGIEDGQIPPPDTKIPLAGANSLDYKNLEETYNWVRREYHSKIIGYIRVNGIDPTAPDGEAELGWAENVDDIRIVKLYKHIKKLCESQTKMELKAQKENYFIKRKAQYDLLQREHEIDLLVNARNLIDRR